ncbi:unnamed protein product [Sphagnum jensenii]|uniref:BIG2 domain-containing protein n=1 Tax=Sphagnum jensenii TaxID=128206 RepID=A0ABP0X3K0_9BRYO
MVGAPWVKEWVCCCRQRLFSLFVLVGVILQLGACPTTASGLTTVVGRSGVQLGPHISSLNLLLPPLTSRPVRYHLRGYNGCFTWSWDHHDILNVEAEFNSTDTECSTGAVLMSIAPYAGRRTTSVHATDTVTGQILRCEVFVDKISRIQIFHHSLKLDLDGLATLRILAFDAEDNVFSSLAGLQFRWQLSPVSQAGDVSHRLTHVALKETPLSDDEIETQITMEQNGLGSDLYVVRGISAGEERVTAYFMEPNQDLMHIITLVVAEAVSLDPPSPLFIIPCTQLQYTLRALRRNEAKVVPLPSLHHRWSLDNSTVADIDPSKGLITARTYGTTMVVVEDLRVAGHQQTSMLHVVKPISLVLYLSPLPTRTITLSVRKDTPVMSSDSPWQVVVGHKYVVQILAFSWESGTQPLLLTKDNDLQLQSGESSAHWRISKVPEDVVAEQGWCNCTLLEALSEGNGSLVTTLTHGVMVQDKATGNWIKVNEQVLRVEQEIMVCTQVKIKTAESLDSLRLPWTPGLGQEYHLSAEGGCGKRAVDFQWSSSNPTVATVNALGVVQTKGLGNAVIRVSALYDAHNNDEVSVDVSFPSAIGPMPGLPVEVEVGLLLPAAIGLRDPAGEFMLLCDAFSKFVSWGIFGADGVFATEKGISSSLFPPIHTMLEDSKAHGLVPAQEAALKLIHPHACAWTLLSVAQAGWASVTASLNVGDSLLEQTAPAIEHPSLETSWTIAAFAPLTLEQASSGDAHGGYTYKISRNEWGSVNTPQNSPLKELLLVPGSSMNVILRGGPERWGQGVEFVDSHEVRPDHGESMGAVAVTHLQEGRMRIYSINCKMLGNYTVVFHRGNLIGENHPTKTIATTSLSLICDVPSAITLLIDKPENSLSQIREAAQVERDSSHCHMTPVTVINGRVIRVAAVALYNSRPFADSSSLIVNWKLLGCDNLAKWEAPESSEKVNYLDGWEQKLVLANVAGKCTVSAAVYGFIPKMLGIAKFTAAWMSQLTDAVHLQLVTALRLEPETVMLFFHPDAKESLSVLGGTSDIKPHVNNSKVAVVAPLDARGLIVAARGLGTALITIRDVGLATPASATALVTVADVAWVKMLLPEDASLQVGLCMTVQLEAGDKDGHVFKSSQFPFMSIQVHVEDEVLAIKPRGDTTAPDEIVVCGANVGLTTTFHVSVQQHSGKKVVTDFARVSVYAPLSIQPSSLVLAPGAKYVLVIHGGPQTSVVVQFKTSHPEIATVDSVTGLLEAKGLGNLTVEAEVHSNGGELLSKAGSAVSVQVPSAMKLNVRGGQLAVGHEITIFPFGTEENLFSFFDQCSNYKWSIGDEQVSFLKFREILKIKSRRWKDTDDWRKGLGNAYCVHMLSAGRTLVTLSFSCIFHYGGQEEHREYTPSGTLWVVPDPPLALGMKATWVLPPDYTSSPLLPQRTKHFPVRTDALSSGHNIVYSVMHVSKLEGDNDAGVVAILDKGRVHTSERMDVACIHARDHSTGRSEIATCIRVAEVASFTVGDDELAVHVAELSVGTDQQFVIVFRDNLGIPFLESGDAIPIVLDTNRADVISIKVADYDQSMDSTNVTIIALRQGTALVRVIYKSDPQIVDWIMIKVGAYVFPQSATVHIGGHVTFSIIGKGERGSWLSGNESIVHVNIHTGEAVAIGEGTTSVSFNGSRLTTYGTITVIQVVSISIGRPSSITSITNVPMPRQGIRFPVKFSDSNGHDIGLAADGHEVSYTCHVEPACIGEAKAWREPGESMFYCVFFPNSPEKVRSCVQKEGIQIQKSRDKRYRDVVMNISAVVEGTPFVKGTQETTFGGGFAIVDSPTELRLSPSSDSLITLVGNVHPGEPEAIKIQLDNESDTAGPGGCAVYKVSPLFLLDFHQTIQQAVLFCSTGQQKEIPVVYKAGQQTVAALSFQVLTAVVIILVLLVLPLIFFARQLDLPRPVGSAQGTENFLVEEPLMNRAPVNGSTPLRSQGQRGFTSPRTPNVSDSTPPATARNFGSRSPPPPFTEYVSKTIENTPYYKRYDPSRTY